MTTTERVCTHGEDGKPFGYPRFPCPWPACPMGPDTGMHWTIPGEGSQPAERYRRTQHLSYSWEKVEHDKN
jgi:hypothetical protein